MNQITELQPNDPREGRLRSKARMGLRMTKSRRALSFDNKGGFMLIDANRNFVMAGVGYNLTLDDVERLLSDN